MPAHPSIVSGEVPASGKKGWREDPLKDATGDVKPGRNAAGRQRKQKPDADAYKKSISEIEKDIEGLKKKQAELREEISGNNPKDAANDERQQIRNRLVEIRTIQGSAKQARAGVYKKFDDLKSSVTRRTNELRALKDRAPLKTVSEVDNKIARLESEVESGRLKLIEEKRLVAEINTLRRTRKTVETFQSLQEAIESDKAALDDVRKQLDDPESKALSAEYQKLQTRLDELSKAKEDENSQRSALFDQRSALNAQLDDAYNRRRAAQEEHRVAMNEWYKAVQEDRERKQIEHKKQREAEASSKRAAAAAAEREAAEVPAFGDEIAGCKALLTYLQQYTDKPSASASAPAPESAAAPAVPECVDALKGTKQPQSYLLRSKKDDDEQYFICSPKGKKGGRKAASPAPTESPSAKLKLPLGVIERFWQFKLDVPATVADVPKAIEALLAKQEWFEKESPRVTAENKAKAEAKIEKLAAEAAAAGDPARIDDNTDVSKKADPRTEAEPEDEKE